MLKDKFERYIEKTGQCWIWRGGKTERGYGMFRIGPVTRRAHRVSYEIYTGEIPSGLCVLHKCDNPTCVNPGHLFVGTMSDNMQDKKRKGRCRNQWTGKLGS